MVNRTIQSLVLSSPFKLSFFLNLVYSLYKDMSGLLFALC